MSRRPIHLCSEGLDENLACSRGCALRSLRVLFSQCRVSCVLKALEKHPVSLKLLEESEVSPEGEGHRGGGTGHRAFQQLTARLADHRDSSVTFGLFHDPFGGMPLVHLPMP